MADLSSYTPIYIRADGDDTTGDGSAGAPYATAQKGFDVAIATASGNYVLDFGAGSFGGVVLSQDWPSRIAVRGVGADQSFLGGVYANGVDANIDLAVTASDAHNISIVGNGQINIGNVEAVGGGSNYSYGTIQGAGFPIQGRTGNGGAVTLQDVKAGHIYSMSGLQYFDYYDYVALGGVVTLSGVIAGDIDASSRSYTFAPSPANGGNVTITNSSVGNITSNGAYDGLLSGSGGAISVISSTCGVITANGGTGEQVTGGGGNVFLSGSTSGNIIANGGNGVAMGYSYTPGAIGGNVQLSNSASGNISALGGANLGYDGQMGRADGGIATFTGYSTLPNSVIANTIVTTNLRKGRGVNGSSILGIN